MQGFICSAAGFLELGPHKLNLRYVFRGNLVPVHLGALTVCAQVFPKCRVKGLSKYGGTFKLATCAFEETILETTSRFTRSKTHSFVKFSGKLASRSINLGSQWISVFFIKRGGKQEKKNTFRYYSHFFIFPTSLNLSTSWSITILFIATEAELDLGLILGSRWFLEGDHVYSPEICAWPFPPPCLTAKPHSLRCMLLEMLYGISQFL